jgi:hypothetical protein
MIFEITLTPIRVEAADEDEAKAKLLPQIDFDLLICLPISDSLQRREIRRQMVEDALSLSLS